MRTKEIEGVTYAPFVVRFRLVSGKRRRWVRWSPECGQWVRGEVARELDERLGVEQIAPHSVTIRRAS